MKRYDGRCHCGRIRFTVEAQLVDAVVCNCSICTKKAFVHVIVPQSRFQLLSGEDALETYTFHTRVARHRFCRVCGIHPFYTPRSHPEMIDVNARCLEGVELDALPTRPFDGKHWEAAMASVAAADLVDG